MDSSGDEPGGGGDGGSRDPARRREDDDQQRADARGTQAAAPSSSTTENSAIEALARAISGLSARSGTSTLELKQQNVVTWKGRGDKGRDVYAEFSIFRASFLSLLKNDGVDDALGFDPIPVGERDVDFDTLIGIFGSEADRDLWK